MSGGHIPFTNGGNGNKPYFMAYRNGDIANALGNGITYDPIFNSSYSNVGSYYNTSTGVFTALTEGRYTFNGLIYVSGVGAPHNNGTISLVTSYRTFPIWRGSPASIRGSSGEVAFPPMSISIPLSLNDTVSLRVVIDGGQQNITLKGDASPSQQFSFFSGFLVS